MWNDDKKRVREAEIRAFDLVEPNNGVEFGEEQFQEFREELRLVPNEIRKDLIIQLLEKLNFSRMFYEKQAGTRISTRYYDDNYYQDYVLRTFLNNSADICDHIIDDVQSLAQLVAYLRTTLKKTFLQKLAKITESPIPLESDEETQASNVAVDEGLLRSELENLQNLTKKVVQNFLSDEPDVQESCELLYVRAVDEKTFDEIARNFNARYGKNLTPDEWQGKFKAVVDKLKNSGELERLKQDVESVNEQLNEFGVPSPKKK